MFDTVRGDVRAVLSFHHSIAYISNNGQFLATMKNEDRIVELLSESLKRQDQMVDQMKGMNGRLDSHEEILKGLAQGQQTLIKLYEKQNDRFEQLEIEIKNIAFYLSRIFDVEKRMNDFEDRISKLEGH